MVLTQSETPTKKLISLTCRISDSQVLSSSIKLSKYSNNWASFPMLVVVTFTVTSRRRLLAEPPGDVLPHPVTIASRSRENIWKRKVISQAMSNVSNVSKCCNSECNCESHTSILKFCIQCFFPDLDPNPGFIFLLIQIRIQFQCLDPRS